VGLATWTKEGVPRRHTDVGHKKLAHIFLCASIHNAREIVSRHRQRKATVWTRDVKCLSR
jgi:hypothetical protein